MRIVRLILLGSIFFIGGLGFFSKIHAQKNDDRALLFFVAKDSVPHKLIGYFYRTQGPLFSDPVAPKLMVASRNQNMILGIGGYVMLRASYDFRGISDNNDFHTYDIPVPNIGNPKSEFRMTAGSSRLFIKLIANTGPLKQLIAYVEGDFQGSSRSFRLRQANISFLGFTFGQALSTFINPKCYAPSIDQNGNISASTQRNPLIRYERSFGKGFAFALGAEAPPFSGTYSTNTAEAHAQMPDFPFYIQYQWKAHHLQLSAIIRDLPYKDIVNDSYRRVFGIGGRLSGAIRITPALQALFYTLYGKGIAAYSHDLSGVGLDMLPDVNKPGKMFAPKIASYYIGAKVNFSSKVYGSATYNYMRLYTNRAFTSAPEFDAATFYKYAQGVTANLFWEFLPSALCGIEYYWGRRTNYSGISGHANRIYTMVRYNF